MRAPSLCSRVLALVAAAGCNEYHYYDIDVTFNIASRPVRGDQRDLHDPALHHDRQRRRQRTRSRMGPANGCPPMTAAGIGPRMGIVEFATFEDSGQLTFTFVGLRRHRPPSTPARPAQGVKTVNATTASTTTETLVVDKIAVGCVPRRR